MVARGLAATRSRARDLVRRGAVMADGKVVTKPGALVAAGANLSIASGTAAFRVSRGALKIEAGLAAFNFDPGGRVALDIGASTGGFTEILLERGARRVYAVDVGHGQLAPQIRRDTRVVPLEKCDARDLALCKIPEPAGCVVADVSFISLTQALPKALSLTSPGAWLLALVKPQFEASLEAIGKGGVVRGEGDRLAAVAKVEAWVGTQGGWKVIGVVPSPIQGGAGNVEYLLGAIRAD